ncbi:hypothetical protein [Frankia gtarii]|uniref:hypothetical protein n=1 Tax=Frankia gtarii TaxID=2950102 RepID=UPI0021BF51D2|nr:hypothetical protein [Frankia gtarii]
MSRSRIALVIAGTLVVTYLLGEFADVVGALTRPDLMASERLSSRRIMVTVPLAVASMLAVMWNLIPRRRASVGTLLATILAALGLVGAVPVVLADLLDGFEKGAIWIFWIATMVVVAIALRRQLAAAPTRRPSGRLRRIRTIVLPEIPRHPFPQTPRPTGRPGVSHQQPRHWTPPRAGLGAGWIPPVPQGARAPGHPGPNRRGGVGPSLGSHREHPAGPAGTAWPWPSRPASPTEQAKPPAQDRASPVQNPRQGPPTHEAGDGRGPATGAVPASTVFRPALHDQVTRIAEVTAGRLAEPLQAWLTQQYGESWLATVNDNRRKAGKPAGRDLRDYRFCLAILGHDPVVQGWLDETRRRQARQLNGLANSAAHRRTMTESDLARARALADDLVLGVPRTPGATSV